MDNYSSGNTIFCHWILTKLCEVGISTYYYEKFDSEKSRTLSNLSAPEGQTSQLHRPHCLHAPSLTSGCRWSPEILIHIEFPQMLIPTKPTFYPTEASEAVTLWIIKGVTTCFFRPGINNSVLVAFTLPVTLQPRNRKAVTSKFRKMSAHNRWPHGEAFHHRKNPREEELKTWTERKLLSWFRPWKSLTNLD